VFRHRPLHCIHPAGPRCWSKTSNRCMWFAIISLPSGFLNDRKVHQVGSHRRGRKVCRILALHQHQHMHTVRLQTTSRRGMCFAVRDGDTFGSLVGGVLMNIATTYLPYLRYLETCILHVSSVHADHFFCSHSIERNCSFHPKAELQWQGGGIKTSFAVEFLAIFTSVSFAVSSERDLPGDKP